jgi:trk system potassium uptake protein TrkA
MKLLIVGCGRVGSAIASRMAEQGHTVSVIDEDAEALQRLPDEWPGRFIQGHGLDISVLVEGGMPDADAVVVATSGDNTNIVIAQIARLRFSCPCVVTRVLDPARAEFYASQGLQTVSPTVRAIDEVTDAICATPGRVGEEVGG